MSLFSALNSAVGALHAQSASISAVAENISNSSTTAYKTKDIAFSSLITGDGADSSGGVTYQAVQNINAQGLIQATSTSTNIAINGDGFFAVTNNPNNQSSADNFSRDGSFATNDSGYLVNNEGSYLLGWATDSSGKITAANSNDINALSPINVDNIKGAAKATANIDMNLNLPADAAVGATFTSSNEVFDSLGVSSTVNQTWTKTASNTWSLALANPVSTADQTTQTGTISPSSVSLTFNGDGSLASTNPSPVSLTISGFTTGASNSTISLNLDKAGNNSGVTQYSSDTTTPALQISSINQDGARFGQLSTIDIDKTGLVTAVFDNGIRQSIYQIPVATFPNAAGLNNVSGSIYSMTAQAGAYHLNMPGEGSSGTITPSALEQSSTDISDEFNKMIVAQQAYSAASQLISTVNTMYQTLMQDVK